LPEFTPDAAWTNLTLRKFWESQGFPELDGWAWYRIAVEVPGSWQGRPVFLSCEGVDDAYELYVNGKLAGSGGDIATRRTAFDEKKSHDITKLVQPGETCVLAVRVYDWFGAGGIFRPVTLGTVPLRPEGDMIR
jgi:beta-galactosidase/beta-glucuronidase